MQKCVLKSLLQGTQKTTEERKKNMNAVRIKNLMKKYKEHTAVDGISFDVVNENLL